MVDKENNFTLIHIVAALMVIVGHMFVLTGMAPVTIMGYQYHVIGVYILFFVAGYLTAGSYERSKSIRSYLAKRLVRLYPPLLFCVLLTALLMIFVSDNPEVYYKSALKWFLDNACLRMHYQIKGVFEDSVSPAINGSLWTLPIEVLCYFLLIPILELVMWIKKKWNLVGGVIASVALIYLFVYVDRHKTVLFNRDRLIIWNTDWFQGSIHMIMFFTGALICILHLDRKLFNLQIGVVVMVLYGFWGSNYVIKLFILGYLIMCFAVPEKPIFSKVIKKDLCYGLYLWAFPVQQVVVYTFGKHLFTPPYIVYLLTSIFFIWIMALIQYELIEKRVCDMLIKRLKRKDNCENK